MAAFEKVIKNLKTGEEKHARVTHFITNNGELKIALNVKYECTKKAAQEAREELSNFVWFVQGLQQAKPEALFEFQKEKIKAKDMNLKKVQLITLGPKGGKAKGFDRELGYTVKQLKELKGLVESGRVGIWTVDKQ